MSIIPIRVNAVCRGPVPSYATPGASGLDVHLVEWRYQDERGFGAPDGEWNRFSDLVLQPGEVALIRTGVSLELPPGIEVQVRGRSGLASKHGIAVLNSPGTIDSDYRGEIGVMLVHLGSQPRAFAFGERIGQLVPTHVVRVELVPVGDLSETGRGAGGFGSTGR